MPPAAIAAGGVEGGATRLALSVADMSQYSRLQGVSTRQDTLLLLERRSHERTRRSLRHEHALVLTTLFSAVIGWFSVRIWLLEQTYARQFEVYRSAAFAGTAEAPRGAVHYTVQAAALAAEYPALFTLRNALTVGGPSLSPEAGRFLLLMLSAFGQHISRTHWSGDATQLHLARLEVYAGSFAGWRLDDNPFRWLLPNDAQAFAHSTLLCEYRHRRSASDMHVLYTGGLCLLAQVRGEVAGTTAIRLARRLVGTRVVFEKQCDAQRRAAAVASMSNAVGAGATALGVISGSGLSLFSGFGLLATVGVLAATAAASAVVGKASHDSFQCPLSEHELAVTADGYAGSDGGATLYVDTRLDEGGECGAG